MTEVTLDQRPSLDRLDQYLTEMAGCEEDMCSHCITLLCDKILPEFKLLRQATLQGMTFEPEGAQFILHGPIRFVVKNRKLTNIDELIFVPMGPALIHGDIPIPQLIDKLKD